MSARTASRPQAAPAAGPRPRRGALSVSWIFTGVAVALTAAAVLSVGFVAERNARAALTAEIEARLLLQTRSLAAAGADALLADFPELTLHPLARQLAASRRELAFVTVLDHVGVVKGDADARRLQTRWAAPAGLSPIAGVEGLEPGEMLSGNATLLVASAPVRQADGRAIGTALIGLKRSYVSQALDASRRQQAVVLAIFLLLGVAAAFLVMSHLLRPLGPLRDGLRRIADGDLETPIALRDRTEFGLLADTVNDMAGALRRARVELVERERLAHEVELARRLQRSLLPAGACAAGAHTVLGAMEPAAEVGGDYFDVLRLADGRIAVAIADVSGKGLAGCLVMTMVSVLLRALRDSHASPAEMLTALDERLSESLQPGVFVTVFYGVLDPRSGRLVWASAGHNPLLVYRHASRTVERLASTGIPLAAVRGGAIRRTLQDQVTDLSPGDVAVQYTDGYTEARAATTEEQFGLDRLAAELERAGADGGAAVLARLDAVLRAWTGRRPADDDRTALVIDRAGAGAAAERGAGDASPERRALALLEAAARDGDALTLPARLDALRMLPEWVERVPGLRDVRGAEAELLRTALYEVCANIVEHGCGGDERMTFDLWWLPPPGGAPARERELDAEQALAVLQGGLFVLRDDGQPFRGDQWRASDFEDAGTWRRGRGLGLDIIHGVMRRVEYVPQTVRGNVTLLGFGTRPAAAASGGSTT